MCVSEMSTYEWLKTTFTQPSGDSPVLKHQRGKALRAEEKKRILTLYDTLLQDNPDIIIKSIIAKVASLLGVSATSVYKIIREYKNTGQVKSPERRRRKRKTISSTIDDSTRAAIRTKIREFYSRNEMPSLDAILAAVNDDDDLPNFRRSTFHRLLTDVGLRFEKRKRKHYLLDEVELITTTHQKYDNEALIKKSNRGRKQLAMNVESEEVGAHSLFEVKHETDDFASEVLPAVEFQAKETIFLQVKEEPTEFVDMGEPPAELKVEGLEFSRIKEEPIEANAVDSELELKKEFEFLPVKHELTAEHHEEDAGEIQLENPLVKEGVPPSGNTSETEKGVYGKWTTEHLSLAVADYLNGHCGLNECSRIYGIPKPTLKRHAENKNIEANGDIKKFGRSQTFSSYIENELEKHILSLVEEMFVVRPQDVRKLAFEIAEQHGIPNRFNAKLQMAGKKWYYEFLKRHPRLSSVIDTKGLKKSAHT